VTGDGFADVITGAGEGGGPHVRVFDGVTGADAGGFFAFEPTFAGGVRVAAGAVTADGRVDIIAGSGPGRAAAFRVFDATGMQVSDVTAYGAAFTGGLFVAAAAPVNRMSIDLPSAGATIHGAIQVAGWGYVESDRFDAGIDAIHVWAVPVAGGTASFVGVATLGDTRPDVAALYGAKYGHAGFHVAGATVPPGTYDIAVFGHSAVSGTFTLVRLVRIVIAP
jgi:hypothetical protein